jgi:Tol biopolymer transport system component
MLLAAVVVALPAPAQGAFPGPNGPIAFTSNRDGDDEIFTVEYYGANLSQLTQNTNVSDTHAAWSADGLKIGFSSTRNDPLYDIYVMDADGGNQTLLAASASEDWEPAFSPDGTQLAFGSNRDGDFDVFAVDANGGNLQQLTNAPDIDRHAVYSPDGGKIAFRAGRDGNGEVYVMDADGSNETNLSNYPSAFDSRPAWSPDGSKVAFNTIRDGNSEIYVMNADGSNQLRLTNHPAADDTPAWSPDGTMIAFVSTRDGGDADIFVMNADGSNPNNLTPDVLPPGSTLGQETWPDWGTRGAVGGVSMEPSLPARTGTTDVIGILVAGGIAVLILGLAGLRSASSRQRQPRD